MQTIQSRIYTNVILTVIALLLAAWVFQPLYSISSTAEAQRQMQNQYAENAQQKVREEDQFRQVAESIEVVAASNKDVAAALRETAESQKEIARAIKALATAGQ